MSTDDRPVLHLTPPSGWLNDPNGLVVHDGRYHLFYQHNPEAIVWGDIHWGHASSSDLLAWIHHPIALAPDHLGMPFSGSVVIDDRGSGGFGDGALVAVYTSDNRGVQRQSLAYSGDGMTWTAHTGNPVLVGPVGHPDFRDPKVIEVDDDGSPHWLMVLAVGTALRFHTSRDLRRWTHTATIDGRDIGATARFEVPDLVRVPCADGGHQWVLLVSTMADAGQATRIWWVPGQHRPGRFEPDGHLRLLDSGPGVYAAQAWPGDGLGSDEGRPTLIAWMDESQHTHSGSAWCGRMSLPRRLRLDEDGALCQEPVLPNLPAASWRYADVGEALVVARTTSILRVPDGGDEVAAVLRDPTGRTLWSAAGRRGPCVVIIDRGSVEVVYDRGLPSWSALPVAGSKLHLGDRRVKVAAVP